MMIERSYEPSFPLALAAKDARSRSKRPAAGPRAARAARDPRAAGKAVEQGHGDADMAAAVEATRP